jgi:transcriptional regulator with XRE-family HTH domain
MFVFVIKQLRESKNISQYKLSQMTDVSRTYLRNLENNKKCNPTLGILSLIAEALDVRVRDLFYEDLQIEELKEELNRRVEKYGLRAKETMEISQIIDLLINSKELPK